jgi:U2 small nuclear ribonucleoprotein A'
LWKQPHDAIDLTDNDIQVLGNLPLSPRLRTLLLAHNRISAIHPNVPNAAPNLRNLVLTGNNLAELADLDVLGRLPRLTHLVLLDNPVTKKEVRFACLLALVYVGLGGFDTTMMMMMMMMG